MSRKPLFLCLAAALLLQAWLTPTRACQYCRLAGSDPEAARLAAQAHARDGSFPLDATLSQFQAAAPAAVLTAPPPAASVATSAADLPPASTRLAPPPQPTTRNPQPATRNPHPASRIPPPVSWADAGLAGLAAAGGWFFWRTRRLPGPVS